MLTLLAGQPECLWDDTLPLELKELPEPGRLSYRQLRSILVEVARRRRVIAFDVVELNPAGDPSGVTARVATWVITHFLSAIFDQQPVRAACS